MLLERDAELAALGEALEALRAGRGAVVGVRAPVGHGRSALLDAFVATGAAPGSGVRVARASAVPAERDHPGAVAEALLDELDGAGPSDRRDAAADLVAAVRGVREPLVLLVDDVHHADGASLRALRRLAGPGSGGPVLLVLSTTGLDPTPASEDLRALWSLVAAPLTPAPLSRDAVTALVREACGGGGTAGIAEGVWRRSGGRALFVAAEVAALTRHVPAGGDAAAGLAEDAARAWLADRLRSAVETLPGTARRVLDGVVLLRGHADLEGLAELVGLDDAECGAAAEALVDLGLLVPDDDPTAPGRPAHPAVAETVETLLGPAERTAAHRRAAELTHRRGAPARAVAEHLLAAGAPADERAVAVVREAAADAWSDAGPTAAARVLRAALVGASPDAGARGVLLADLVEAEREFDPPAALLHVLQALDLTDDPLDRAALYARIAPAGLGAAPAPLEVPLRRLGDELEALAAREPQGGAPGPATTAAARVRAREWYLGLERPDRLRSIADRLGPDDGDPRLESAAGREQLAVVLHAAVLAVGVDAAETDRRARRLLERERPGTEHIHRATALPLFALVAADHVAELATWLAEVATAADLQGCPVARCVVAGEQAVVAVAEGRHPAAREHLAAAAALFDPRWNDDGHTVALTLVPVAAALDSPELSSRLLSLLRRRQSSSYAAAGAAYAAGRDALRRDDPRQAADHFRTAGTLVEQSGWVNPAVLPWRAALAKALHRAGETAAALDVLAEEQVRAQEWGAPVLLGRAQRLRAHLLGGTRGRAALGDAVDVLAGSCNAREAALASLALGHHLRADGDPAAREHLSRARELAQRCEDPELLAAVRASGTGAGPSRRPDAVTAGAAELTRAERRVAELAVEGRTNGEIAAALGISVRGVEKHLTRCYRKTGAAGRAALAAALPAAPDG